MTFRGDTTPTMPLRGIDNSQGDQLIGEDFAVAMHNVHCDNGDWTQRSGYAPYITSAAAAAAVVGINWRKFKSGNPRFILATAAIAGSAGLWKDNGSGGWTSIKGALAFTGTKDNLFSFAVLNDVVIGTNGVDQLFKYSDVTDPAVVLGGTPPSKAKCLLQFRNRILAANVTVGGVAKPSTVVWCALNNPDDWTSNSSGSAAPALDSSMECTGLGAVATEAFLFYDKAIYSINPTGDDKIPFAFPEHALNIGCVSPQSIITVPGTEASEDQMYFASADGIYRMTPPGYRPKLLSDRISTTWSSLNATRHSVISSGWLPSRHQVWWSVSSGSDTTHSLMLVYDYRRDAWYTYGGILANAFANYQDSTGVVRLVHGDFAGWAYNQDTGTADKPADVSTAIDAYVTSKAYALADGHQRGGVKFADIWLLGQTAECYLQLNYGYDMQGLTRFKQVAMQAAGSQWGGANWGTGTWGAVGQIYRQAIIGGNGMLFQFQVRNAVLDKQFRVYRIAMGAKVKKRYAPVPSAGEAA